LFDCNVKEPLLLCDFCGGKEIKVYLSLQGLEQAVAISYIGATFMAKMHQNLHTKPTLTDG
jgi:hypothetical protein